MEICVLKNRTIQIEQRNIANRHNSTQDQVGFLAFPSSVPFRVRIEMSFSMSYYSSSSNILQSCRTINSHGIKSKRLCTSIFLLSYYLEKLIKISLTIFTSVVYTVR